MTDGPDIPYAKNNSIPHTDSNNIRSNEEYLPRPDISNDEKDRLELIFQLIKERLGSEMQRINDLDTKAGNLIGYTSIVTSLLIGLGTFDILEKLSKPEFYVPYFLGIGSLLASIITALISVRIMSFLEVPDSEALISTMNVPDYWFVILKVRLISSMHESIIINKSKNDGKASWITVSWIFLIIGISLIVLYVTIYLYINQLK